ncbi:MAG: translocation/assembly module TamB domain-containing protein [candidate division WOR-3 bacterium]|nr:translocation/assembly module TamB domain-containing protein [candidate division WOR-3 bacterium]
MSIKRKIFIIILSIMLFISVALPIFVNTPLFNRIVREYIENTISTSIDGECRIGKLTAGIVSYRIDSLYISNPSVKAYFEKTDIGISIYSLLAGKVLFNFIEMDEGIILIKEQETQSGQSGFIYDYEPVSVLRGLDIKSLKVTNLDIQYDTLQLSNLNFISSVSLSDKRLAVFINVQSADIPGKISLERSTGEIVMYSNHAKFMGDIKSNNLDIKYDINMHDSTIDIRNLDCKLHTKSLYIGNDLLNAQGRMGISGFIKGSRKYLTLNGTINSVNYRNLKIPQISTVAVLKDSSIIIENIEMNDSLSKFTGSGFADLNNFPESELSFDIKSMNYYSFADDIDMKPHSISGLVSLKISSADDFSIMLDSVSGYWGSDTLKNLNGSIAYADSSFFARDLTAYIGNGSIGLNGMLGPERGRMSARLDNFPSGLLNNISGIPYVEGQLYGDIMAENGYRNFNISLDINMQDIIIDNSTFDNLILSGSIDNHYNGTVTMKLIGGNAWGIDIELLYGEFKKNDLNIYTNVSAIFESGYLEYEGDFVWNDSDNFNGLIRTLSLNSNGKRIFLSKPVYINVSDDSLEISDIEIYGNDLLLTGSMRLIEDSIDVYLKYDDDSLFLLREMSNLDIYGNLGLELKANTRISDPVFNVSIDLRQGRYEDIVIDSFLFASNFNKSRLTFDRFELQYGSHASTAEGYIEFNELNDMYDDSINIDLDINHITGKFLSPFYEIFTVDNGFAEGVINLSGNLRDPVMSGTVNIMNADVNIIDLGTTVKNVNAGAYLRGDSIVIEGINGKTANGHLNMTGLVLKDGYMIDNYRFALAATGIHSDGIDYTDAYGNAQLDIKGTLTKASIAGNIEVTKGLMTIPFIDMSSSDYQSTSIDSSYIDLTIKSKGDLWIKNNFVDVEMKGDVRILKDVSQLNITGRADIIRGFYYYIDKRFTVTDGYFNLRESNKVVDPYVSINSRTRVNYYDIDGYKDADIFLKVSGNLDEPEITLFSQPAMDMDEILSILSFNTSVAALNSVGKISKTLPEKALQVYLRSNYLNAVSSSIGLDQLNIETNLLSDEKSAKLSVGKYISRDLFISYTHDIFSFARDMFQIEYNITENSQIITERDNEGNVNAGFQFKFRY